MADGPAPARDMTASSDEFREIAEAAGKELKEVLQKDFGSAAKYQGFADFDIKPYETILKDVMEVFETQVFKQLHEDGSKLEWRVIRLITKPRSFDENSYGSRSGNPWILALNVRMEGKIGQSFSVKREHSVEAGDIFLGYAVKKAEVS